jgi:hypothetical protein
MKASCIPETLICHLRDKYLQARSCFVIDRDKFPLYTSPSCDTACDTPPPCDTTVLLRSNLMLQMRSEHLRECIWNMFQNVFQFAETCVNTPGTDESENDMLSKLVISGIHLSAIHNVYELHEVYLIVTA